MEIHNTAEDIVLRSVDEIFDDIERQGAADRPCTCSQCRLDTACYVLNRVSPRYVISSRGVERAEQESIDRQQIEADVASLVYEGLQRIASARRPHFQHDSSNSGNRPAPVGPVFNFPTVVGRIFNGQNFEPLSDITLTFFKGASLAVMIDPNWQNPYSMVANTAGTFSFWPAPESCAKPGIAQLFSCSILAEAPGYESLRHFFELTLTSEEHSTASFSMQRTVRLPDLYIFPPGDEADQ